MEILISGKLLNSKEERKWNQQLDVNSEINNELSGD